MKQFSRFLLFAFAVLMSAPTWASMHGAPVPPFDGLLGALVVEVQHFGIHLTYTLQALMTVSASPATAFAMLSDQGFCASHTPITAVLFGGMVASLMTVTLLGMAVMFTIYLLFKKVVQMGKQIVFFRPSWGMA